MLIITIATAKAMKIVNIRSPLHWSTTFIGVCSRIDPIPVPINVDAQRLQGVNTGHRRHRLHRTQDVVDQESGQGKHEHQEANRRSRPTERP